MSTDDLNQNGDQPAGVEDSCIYIKEETNLEEGDEQLGGNEEVYIKKKRDNNDSEGEHVPLGGTGYGGTLNTYVKEERIHLPPSGMKSYLKIKGEQELNIPMEISHLKVVLMGKCISRKWIRKEAVKRWTK